mmetsp:Transcript_2385/g.6892  ORF Transcript_2385/g.6892 Transcript_2385/m.6892 type:complete len:84 (-) Transcript_2385:87-338(-)
MSRLTAWRADVRGAVSGGCRQSMRMAMIEAFEVDIGKDICHQEEISELFHASNTVRPESTENQRRRIFMLALRVRALCGSCGF